MRLMGVLKRLEELGILRRLSILSTVSGGSSARLRSTTSVQRGLWAGPQ